LGFQLWDPTPQHPKHGAQATGVQACLAPTKPTQQQTKSWVEVVHHHPTRMSTLLSAGTLQQDLTALRENHKIPQALSRQVDHRSLSAKHRAIRARLYLRMARFYRKNYSLALHINHDVYLRRQSLQSSLHIGRLFHYYLGRLQCLRQQPKAAARSFQQALQLAPNNRLDRIRAWQAACHPNGPQKQILDGLSFKQDPKGWSEWLLVHHLYHLKPASAPPVSDTRSRLYARVTSGQPARWPAGLVRAPIDREMITENGIEAPLDYYDPSVSLLMSHDYAQRALKLLQNLPAHDHYAPFYRAEAHHLLGQQRHAQRQWSAFLAHPPTKLNGAYLFFSHRQSIQSLQQEACYHQAKSIARHNKPLAYRLLQQLSKTSYSGKALAGLGLIQLAIEPQLGFKWLREGARRAEQQQLKAQQTYALAAIENTSRTARRGAQIISQFALYRYQARSIYMWGSMGALLTKHGNTAADWLEQLHRKNTPYQIIGENEPLQFLWTARAYISIGKPGVASLFLSKNLKQYPSLTPIWDLLRVLRIYKGMGGFRPIKG
jgi:hypothetical protein